MEKEKQKSLKKPPQQQNMEEKEQSIPITPTQSNLEKDSDNMETRLMTAMATLFGKLEERSSNFEQNIQRQFNELQSRVINVNMNSKTEQVKINKKREENQTQLPTHTDTSYTRTKLTGPEDYQYGRSLHTDDPYTSYDERDGSDEDSSGERNKKIMETWENSTYYERKRTIPKTPLRPSASLQAAEQSRRMEEEKRRQSSLGAILRFDEEVKSRNENTKIHVASDKHLEIIWSSRTVDGFLNFLEDVNDFQVNNEMQIKYLYGHIHRDIRDYLGNILSELWPNKYPDGGSCYKATKMDISEAARLLMAPRDLEHFTKVLTASCKRYEVKQLGIGYTRTKQDLTRLKHKFRERYEFLTGGLKLLYQDGDIPADMIPALNFKQGGLLNVWMDLTPVGARKSFITRLIQGTYPDLNSFFIAFFKIVEENYVHSQSAITYKSRIASTEHNGQQQQQRPIHMVHNITEEEHYHLEADRELGDFYWQFQQDEYSEGYGDGEYGEEEQEELHYVKGNQIQKNNQQHMKNKHSTTRSEQKHDQLCLRYLTGEKCNDACKYSHTWLKREEMRKKLIESWGGTVGKQLKETINGPPRSNSHRLIIKDKDGHGRKTAPGMQDVRVIEHEDDEDEHMIKGQQDDCDDENLHMIASLLQTGLGSKSWKAAHKHATITTSSGIQLIHPVAILFDSGASASSYISDSFIQKMGLQDMVKKSGGAVRVANGEVVQLDGEIDLQITFESEDGDIVHWCTFKVLKGLNEELILGISDIISKFLKLFVGMLSSTELNYLKGLEATEEMEPWSVKPEVPEEEDSIVEPAIELNFMERAPELEVEKYLAELPSRVSTEFADATDAMEMLRDLGSVVFVPWSWNGINMDPVTIEFTMDLPSDMKPYRSRIPHGLEDAFYNEIDRLLKYLLFPSNSPIASPVVVTGKNTYPFVRICGDFRRINKYCAVPKFPIPNVIQELHKLTEFDMFHDLDVMNAFHQIPICKKTSRILSIQTPNGQYEPKFLPEGVSCASMILMRVMSEIFQDFSDWVIVIHDNILVLCKGCDDAYIKLVKVLQRCKERNLYLKLSKSHFGIRSVDFFGYHCVENSYSLSAERANSITAIPFPSNIKGMQRFLGMCMYFQPFIYNYSKKTALLNDMVHKNFNWDSKTWNEDYVAKFNELKEDIRHAHILVHPNYTFEWFLYTDASDIACGGVLIQKTPDGQQQVISFVSKKFSEPAKNWSTYEKEAFGIYFTVNKLQHYLHAKSFTILTDHRNLVWIETSVIPKIIRIRLFLQTFKFKILHIAGKDNIFADWTSRIYEEGVVGRDSIGKDNDVNDIGGVLVVERIKDKIYNTIASVHNSRMGHQGIRRTWLLLNQYHPGHNISMDTISEFISTCASCQKYRLGMNDSIAAPTRVLSSEHRHTCGYDLLYVTPDADGNKYIHVIKLLPSRVVGLYPTKELTAESFALNLFQFFLTYGVVDVLVTDPGKNINAEVTKLLLEWFGVRLKMSLVNRHQSNGVERTHREVLKFLSMLVGDERISNHWSKPQVLGVIQFIINSQISGETGKSPFDYLFGSVDSKWLKLPDLDFSKDISNQFIKALDENIRNIREAAYDVIARIQNKRLKQAVNNYQIGDFVLVDAKAMNMKSNKLAPNYYGPYTVEHVYKSDLTLKHLVTGDSKEYHMEHVKPYFSESYEDAYKAALIDHAQHVIDCVVNWAGDTERRSIMNFLVRFLDGEELWLPYGKDLCDTIQFRTFCESHPPLQPLLTTEKEWKTIAGNMNKKMIAGVKPGDTCFVDIRAWGWQWFRDCNLPDPNKLVYVVTCDYVSYENKSKKKILISCPLFKEKFYWRNSDIVCFGMVFNLSVNTILVDAKFCEKYPQVLSRGEDGSSFE